MKYIIWIIIGVLLGYSVASYYNYKKLYKAAIHLQIENTNLKQDKSFKSNKIMRIEGFFPDKNYKDCIRFKIYYFKK